MSRLRPGVISTGSQLTNPGGERFYKKLFDRFFNQVMLHKINKCEWNQKTRLVTSPNLRSKLLAIIEFESQDWVKNLAQADANHPKKQFADPYTAFLFQDDFSVGTIHGTNMKPPLRDQGAKKAKAIKIADNDNDVSVLTTKTQDELLALLL
jgi:hypothetical protein